MLDSLAPSERTLTCRAVPKEYRLPDQPPHHSCVVAGDSTVAFDVGRRGRILGVVQNWGVDSLGRRRTQQALVSLERRFGRPAYAGDDSHGNLIHAWRSDSVCATLYELREPAYVQLSYRTPEFLGRCAY